MKYQSVHRKLDRLRGRAKTLQCGCGAPAAHWAYQHSSENPLFDEDGRVYSEDIGDYAPMCIKCHRRLDWEATPNRHLPIREAARETIKAAHLWEQQLALSNPEMSRQRKSNAGKGRGAWIAHRFLTEPQFAARRRIEMAKASGKKRKCDQCEMVSTTYGLGSHQRWSGHSGYSEVLS